MAQKKAASAQGAPLAPAARAHRFCSITYPKGYMQAVPAADERSRLLRETRYKWLNGSQLRYWFFDKPRKWAGTEADRKVVRQAFQMWKALGIGLDFAEVTNAK